MEVQARHKGPGTQSKSSERAGPRTGLTKFISSPSRYLGDDFTSPFQLSVISHHAAKLRCGAPVGFDLASDLLNAPIGGYIVCRAPFSSRRDPQITYRLWFHGGIRYSPIVSSMISSTTGSPIRHKSLGRRDDPPRFLRPRPRRNLQGLLLEGEGNQRDRRG
jgi:hypothetical protein